MPTSDYNQISEVMHAVDFVSPNSILEIGVGFGKFGVLFRELLEVGKRQNLDPKKWEVRIEGIEIFADYRNQVWDYAYNKVHIGDALPFLRNSKDKFDLIICCDVIEHFEKEEGQLLLSEMLKHGKVVLLTSPLGFMKQDPIFGNPHEEHKSEWGLSDFKGIPHVFKKIRFTFIALLSLDPKAIEEFRFHRPLDSLGFKKGIIELARVALERVQLKLGKVAGFSLTPGRHT